jgi:isocitrate lyase
MVNASIGGVFGYPILLATIHPVWVDAYPRLDPVQITQMAKHLETVYVSGWQCSSTASSSLEPGPDLAGKS